MKKITLLFSFVLIFIFTSCKNQPAPIVRNFSATFTAQCNGVEVTGKFVVNKNKVTSIKVTSPDAMKGYLYYYKNDNLTIEYEEMKVVTQPDYLPKTALPSILYNIFSSLSKENNCYLYQSDEYYAVYKGNCDSGKYIIKTQYSMGTITEITIDNIAFSVRFRDIRITE